MENNLRRLHLQECSQTYGFLNKDGSVTDMSRGMTFKDIESWFGNKREGPVTRHEAYSHTFYRQTSLLSICAKHCNPSQKSGNTNLTQTLENRQMYKTPAIDDEKVEWFLMKEIISDYLLRSKFIIQTQAETY
jgi:hypothetical protein